MAGSIQAPPFVNYGYDPTTHLYLPTACTPVLVDATNNEEYALAMNVNVTNASGANGVGTRINKEIALSASGANALLLPSMDVSAYDFFSFHSGTPFSATYQFQGSNDNVDFVPMTCFRLDNMDANTSNVQSNGTTQMWGGPLPYRFLQIQIVTYVSGTVTGTLELFNHPLTMPVVAVDAEQLGTWNVGLNAGSNVIGAFNNDGVSCTAVASGTVADTTIKATAGRLARILVTATGTANVLIFDNASGHTGTIIGVIKSSAAVGDVIELRIPAANGITVQGNANNGGFTVSWV